MSESILRCPAVLKMTGLSRSGLYNRMNPQSHYHDPEFPLPVKIGMHAVGWKNSEVQAWITQRPRASSQE
ncbi:helix-turn-helix transcriptional regulator [Silvimonas soli]|uniref:helix-turn-helix transcriptional regulator n=1 Tax=Silvimonas soli TaxID=2980100 RepID=UPI0036F1CFA4